MSGTTIKNPKHRAERDPSVMREGVGRGSAFGCLVNDTREATVFSTPDLRDRFSTGELLISLGTAVSVCAGSAG